MNPYPPEIVRELAYLRATVLPALPSPPVRLIAATLFLYTIPYGELGRERMELETWRNITHLSINVIRQGLAYLEEHNIIEIPDKAAARKASREYRWKKWPIPVEVLNSLRDSGKALDSNEPPLVPFDRTYGESATAAALPSPAMASLQSSEITISIEEMLSSADKRRLAAIITNLSEEKVARYRSLGQMLSPHIDLEKAFRQQVIVNEFGSKRLEELLQAKTISQDDNARPSIAIQTVDCNETHSEGTGNADTGE